MVEEASDADMVVDSPEVLHSSEEKAEDDEGVRYLHMPILTS